MRLIKKLNNWIFAPEDVNERARRLAKVHICCILLAAVFSVIIMIVSDYLNP